MLKEPLHTLHHYQSRDDDPQGYQHFKIDTERNQLIPLGRKTKAKLLAEFLRSVIPGKTVLDLGCDKGYFSYLAADLGASKVIANDVNARSLNYASILFKIMKKQNVEVVLGNLAGKNIQCDWVLALAVIHQLHLGINESLTLIHNYCKEGAVIEFCDDYRNTFGKTWNVDYFCAASRLVFSEVKLIGEYEASGCKRSIWCCYRP